MTESGDAAEQVVRMMLSGSEVAVRLAGAGVKNGVAMLLALMKNHKKVYGKTSMVKMLKNTRDIRVFTMTPAQFKQFKAKAKKMKILYSAVQDKHNRNAPVDVILPTTELERANMVFEKIKFVPEQEKQADQPSKEKQQEKNASRSEPGSRDTKDRSSTRSGSERTNERPSVEQKLKENKAAKEKQRQDRATARNKQRTKKKSKGRSK